MLKSIKFIILFLPLLRNVLSHSIQVTEDSVPYPEWNETQFIEAIRNSKEMQKYMENTRNYVYLNNPTMDSYIVAYNLQHEDYQNNEEAKETKARRERRSAPSPPQLIKFELADAKEPDEATKEFMRRLREQRNMREMVQQPLPHQSMKVNATRMGPPNIIKEKDQAVSETREVKVIHHLKPIYGIDKLPLGVQKAIEKVLQDKAAFKEQSSLRYVAPITASKLLQSDKIPKLLVKAHEASLKAEQLLHEKAKQLHLIPLNQHQIVPSPPLYTTLIPVVPVSNEAGGVDHASAENENVQSIEIQPSVQVQPPPTVELVNIIPKVNYYITEVPTAVVAPAVEEALSYQHVEGPQAHVYYPQEIPVEVNSVQEEPAKVVETEEGENYEQQIAHEHNLFQEQNEIQQPKLYFAPLDTDAYKQLTSLIGKAPTDQLQGLKYLLLKDAPVKQVAVQEKQAQRPQDNTAPILFHPKEEQDNSNQEQEQEQEAPKEEAGYKPQNQVTESPLAYKYTPKSYTPVTENVQDITEPANVVPKEGFAGAGHAKPPPPPPTSYSQVNNGGIENHYQGLSKKPHGLTYASRYAFGYRVRDYHTGNDFGHTQKRDMDGITRGEYHILLPDGRVQNVRYHADDTGFHADIQHFR